MKTETSSHKTLSDRLSYALSLTGTKKADLARAISVKPQVIQFLCNSKTQSSRFTFEIATVLGLNTRWLATGEGEMFIADDPKQQFLKTFTRVPLLNFDLLKNFFLTNKSLDDSRINTWLPLKTNDKNSFAVQLTDASMEPIFPINSFIFISPIMPNEISVQKYVFAYLVKFDTFVIREIFEHSSSFFLTPKNNELFKEIEITPDVKILGIVTDCFWHVRS